MPSDVLLGYLHPNEVTASFQKSLLDLIGYDLSGPRRISTWAMVKCGSGGIADGRNDLAKRFLETDCQWLFMVDADMGFAPHTLSALLSVADGQERPIVGGLAFAQRESHADGMNGFRCFPRPTLFDWIEHEDGHFRMTGRAHYPANSLVKVGATGGACILIHRKVFEAIGPDPFDQLRDPNGSGKQGEDISFCVRAQDQGFPVFVHTGIRTTHYKHLWLQEDDFWTSFIPPPATEEVDILIPVLHRPQNVGPLMESLRASTGLATAYFIGEAHDEEEMDAVLAAGAKWLSFPEAHTFAEKVNAASEALQGRGAPWLPGPAWAKPRSPGLARRDRRRGRPACRSRRRRSPHAS